MKKEGKNSIKSQVTIFIVISIIIVLIFLIFYLIKYNGVDTPVSNEVEPIYNIIHECIEISSINAIYSIGLEGGYFVAPENSSTINKIPYYYLDSKKLLPGKTKIESEINNYLDAILENCYYNLINFSDYVIIQGRIKTDSQIRDNEVYIKIEYPLDIKKATRSYKLNDFEVILPVRLNKIIEFSKNITEQVIDDDQICLTCINDYSNEYDFFVEINDFDEKSVVFTIIDKKFTILNEEYRFNFALEYDE